MGKVLWHVMDKVLWGVLWILAGVLVLVALAAVVALAMVIYWFLSFM